MGLRRTIRNVRSRLVRSTFRARDFDDTMPLLWSKGIARLCDVRGPEDYWLAPTESVRDAAFFRAHYTDARGLVWLRLGTRTRYGEDNDLDRFVESALPTVKRPFVLITTDGDETVPSGLRPATVTALLASPYLRAWFTQNHDGSGGPKLKPFPIGLDLHTPRPFSSPNMLLRNLEAIAAARRPPGEQPLRVFCDIGLNPNSDDRREAMRILAGCPHIDFQTRRVGQRAIWRRYATTPFVLSLAGNGLDCHRTWEALCLGSLVIVKRSSIDPLYAGLPVAIIDDIAELRDARNLDRWRQELAPLAGPERMRQRLDPRGLMARIRVDHLDGDGS